MATEHADSVRTAIADMRAARDRAAAALTRLDAAGDAAKRAFGEWSAAATEHSAGLHDMMEGAARLTSLLADTES